MPLAPVVAELYARGEKERLQRLITKSAWAALLGSLPIALGMILFGRWVLLIFGKDFTGGNTALAILSAGQLVNVGMGSVALLLNMTGHERDTARGVGIAALANIILNAALIPLWNINGAAAASAISLAIWNILLAWWVYKRIGICSIAFGSPRRKRT
jgi:O-antigen/teichoic acid export membrane protein